MTIKLDPKSVVVGGVVAIVVLIAMGVAGRSQDVARNTDASGSLKGRLSSVEQMFLQKLTSPQSDRFRMKVNADHAVIFDTATGQAWKHILHSSRGDEVFPAKLQPAGD